MIFDLIIVGGGPSALSAALYAGRYKTKTLLVTDFFGGLAAVAGKIENYPGFKTIDGHELIEQMVKQVKALESVTTKEGSPVEKISDIKDGFVVRLAHAQYKAKAVLVCTGKKPRQLGIAHEDDLVGRGLSYCSTCDGPLSKGRDVIVIGGGRSATESALNLEKIASSVTIININPKLEGEVLTLDKLTKSNRINIINNAKTTDFILDNMTIKGIRCELSSGRSIEITGQMVFIEIGQQADPKPFKDLVKTTKDGEIVVDLKTNRSSKEGIFASGDITDINFKQIVIAAGEGAKAAMSIHQYLKSQ